MVVKPLFVHLSFSEPILDGYHLQNSLDGSAPDRFSGCPREIGIVAGI
jgi:hypothetical protein